MLVRGSLLTAVFAVALCSADAPATKYNIQTIAGGDAVGDGGPALAALLSQAEGIAIDNQGAVYVADAQDNRVRKITPDGVIQTVAGNGTPGFAGDGGPAAQALLNHPYGLAVDASRNVYIADLGNARVRRVSADGIIQTVAGGGTIVPGGNGDGGPATSAQLVQPRNVAVQSDGTLYVSDFAAHRVYQISPGGTLVTFAGTGNAGFSGDNQPASMAQLKAPAGLAIDSFGALYIADSGNNRIRKVANGTITTVLTVVSPTGLAIDSTGALYVAAASFLGTSTKTILGISAPQDVALNAVRNLYVTSGEFVRKVAAAGGAITTFAGSGASLTFGGDNGPATSARLNAPTGLAIDAQGNRYIADSGNNRIRKITPAGVITTIAGTGDPGAKGDSGLATAAQLNRPRSLAVDSQQNLYIADSGNNAIRKITPAGFIFTVATQFNDPEYVAIAPDQSLYVADTGNNRVLNISPAGGAYPVTQILGPSALFIDATGNLLISGQSQVVQVTPTGVVTTVLGGLSAPHGLVRLNNGDLLVAETGVNVIRKLSASGALSVVAGTGVAGFSGDGFAAGAAQLNTPFDLALDASGAVLIADSGNNRIRSLTPSIAAAPAAAGMTLVHAATMLPGPIAPSEIITIFGNSFAPGQTQLMFDGAPATVFYSSKNQINALAPASLAVDATTEITIQANGATVADFYANTTTAVPGIFTTSDGTGPAAAVNEDGSINSASNPATRGSVVSLYATGEGSNISSVSMTIGGYPAALLYAGPAPGFPGLMQINAQIPGGFLAPGIQPVVLKVGTAASQSGVTIAIQ